MLTQVRAGRRTGLRNLIIGHPMISFFVIAFGLSWIAWTPYVVSENGLGLVPFAFPEVLGTSQLLGMLPGAYLGPITAAFLVIAITDGKPGLRGWVKRLSKWRVNWRWYVVCLAGVPAALIITTIPFAGLENMHLPAASVLIVFIPGLVLQILTTGLAEEPGWRDFALPRLQPRFGPLRGNLILGPLWGAWHLPLFLTEWGGYPDVTWLRVGEFVLSCIAISIAMTWVFNRTGESLPLAMLMHVSINNYHSILAASIFPTVAGLGISARVTLIAFGAAAIVLIMATRGRLGYRPASTLSGVESPTARYDSHV